MRDGEREVVMGGAGPQLRRTGVLFMESVAFLCDNIAVYCSKTAEMVPFTAAQLTKRVRAWDRGRFTW